MQGMSLAPKLSFIVLSYNYADMIDQTIRSILDQTVQDFEIIVVDDASTDPSCSVVRSFADPRIRLLVNERNLGGAGSYNRAVQAARGDYLVNLDADDWITPDKCERQLSFLSQNPVAVLGSYVNFVDREGRPASRAELEAVVNAQFDLNAVDSWIGQNRLVRSSTIVERAAHLAVGLDDPSMVRAPDYELWTRFLRAGHRFAVLPERLVYYRTHPGGVTHADPLGTFLEMSYAALRNLLPAIEEFALWPSLSRISDEWISHSMFPMLRPVERYRLLGMLVIDVPVADFAAFRGAIGGGSDEDAGLVRAGRRLFALSTRTTNIEQKLQADIVAYIEARDFWYETSQNWEAAARDAATQAAAATKAAAAAEAAAMAQTAHVPGRIRTIMRTLGRLQRFSP